jgi:hypothetical protein
MRIGSAQLGTAHLALGACGLAAFAAAWTVWPSSNRDSLASITNSARVAFACAQAYFLATGLFHLWSGRSLRRGGQAVASLPLAVVHGIVLVSVARVFSREEQSAAYLGGLERVLAMLMVLSLLAIVVLAVTRWRQPRPALDFTPAAARLCWGLCVLQGSAALAVALAIAWVDTRPWPG